MAYNNYQQVPFWDFVRGLNQNGAGVDRPAEEHPFFGPAGGPFPPPPPYHDGPFGFGGAWGPRGGFGGFGGPGACRGGRRGRHGRRDGSGERSHHGSRSPPPPGEHHESEGEAGKEDGSPEGRRHGHGHGPHGPHGRRGPHAHGWGGRGRGGHHGRRGPPPPFGGPGGMGGPEGMGGFDMSGLLNTLNTHPIGQHPWAQFLRQYAEQAGLAGQNQRSSETLVPQDADENSFIPPIDIFSTETAYILHIALPGAKKEDVGVNWDSDASALNIAGVVYRQGDEEFLKTLSKSERKVGVFERTVKLPPGEEEKEEVDGDAITAKLEDGILVVKVPKVEKEWTEVKRVDIE